MFDKIVNEINLQAERFHLGVKKVLLEKVIWINSQIFKHGSNSLIAQLLYLLEKLTPNPNNRLGVSTIRKDFAKKGPWYQMLKKLFYEINPKCRQTFINNFAVNSFIIGEYCREQFEKKEGFRPPWFIVISPSMTCNLRCVGCYAGEYSKRDDLPYEVLDKLIDDAKKMGVYFFTISGGEPLFRKDLLKIFAKHNDCYFLIYTNGTLVNTKLAKKLAELGNVTPGISVEGFEKETDARRGKGTYKKVLIAMKNLKKEGVPFGFSATPTSLNSDVLASEKFLDFYTKQGCLFGWYFQYIPIGRKPDINLMATPAQRNRLRLFVKKMRKTKPIFIGDFWNDGPYVGGCMAGGSLYLHVNVKGDVEPCVFVHFAVDNIKKKSLKECLKSKFFYYLRDHVQANRAPKRKSDNLLAPCMIIDNPEVLRDAVKKGNACPTHDGAETIVSDPKITKALDCYSCEWHEITDKVSENVWKPDTD